MKLKKIKLFWFGLKKYKNRSLHKTSDEYNKYYYETIIGLKNNIYSSFDHYINQKYKVEVNYKTLERLKNYFR